MTIPSGVTNQEKRPNELCVAREPMIPHSRPENMEVWSGIVFYWLAERQRSAARDQGIIHTDRFYRESAASLGSAEFVRLQGYFLASH